MNAQFIGIDFDKDCVRANYFIHDNDGDRVDWDFIEFSYDDSMWKALPDLYRNQIA